MADKNQHREAFALMNYLCEKGCSEQLWNSRDGVTPFVIHCATHPGSTMQHVNWSHDKYQPDWIPKIGDRVFVDCTLERLLEHERKKVARFWDEPSLEYVFEDFDTQEEAAQHFARKELEERPGAPDIRVVDAGFLEWLKTHRGKKAGGN
jgi:hypothetical protein